MEKKYWQSLEAYKELKKSELPQGNEPHAEFSIEGLDESEIKGKSSRRDFLKMLGFSVSAVALASSCQTPIRKAIPLLNQPEDLIPGVPNFYASTFFDGIDYCSILVKTRENRPIKIEGNDLSPLTKSGTSARVQASVLNLYDDARLRKPFNNGNESDWETIDREISQQLGGLAQEGKSVVLLTSTIISPTTRKLIKEFREIYPNITWTTYDEVSASAIRKANEQNFGRAVIPFYHFDKATVIVSFNADFLGNWLLPVTFSKQFSGRRKLSNGNTDMSRLYMFESAMSLTGSNADYRIPIKPSEEGLVLMSLYNEIAGISGATTYPVPSHGFDVKQAAMDLLDNKGKSLVVSGTNNVNIQLIVNAINQLLGNYASTIDLNKTVNLKQGDDERMRQLVAKMNQGQVAGLLMYNVNPAYNYPQTDVFISGLKKVGLKVSFAETMDETALLCDYVCPDNNYLESWNDAEAVKGYLSITQPTIQPIFNTRQFQDSLMAWGSFGGDFSTYLEANWKGLLSSGNPDGKSWAKVKHDGVYTRKADAGETPGFIPQGLKLPEANSSGVELALYEKIGIGTGKYSNNPWLLEMPDPITTATWDNYACVSPKFAEEHQLQFEDVVKINGQIELPVLVQPGQAYGTVSIALGFGRTAAGKAGNNVGQNVYRLMNGKNSTFQLSGEVVSLEKVIGKTYPLALTQMHHTMEGRPIARETTLRDFIKNPSSGNEKERFNEENNTTLYQKVNFDGIQWGMSIDLSSCTGCANCVIACQAENNVAVIGKEQVKNRRIMHWMRIDRYYSEDVENPEVFHMPTMCQHCDNAPCENVCPVAATNHSTEGLNQMAYNRCIGTRYCINNCPYKVRRFNWFEFTNNNQFDYNMNSELGKMVLNPDVIVRQRGVVEKCSLCIQRIQEKKLLAKMENRPLKEGEVVVACQQSCPTDAIGFGNLQNPSSKVSKERKEKRTYHLLGHLHTLPSTTYMTKVRNKES
ncbi:MAG: Fe-S-cluster-containing hydrogenase [Bacteroidales bacterium]|nr:Fe-S-cluster-containing hydrogenase [Bacteroidales bacterium]